MSKKLTYEQQVEKSKKLILGLDEKHTLTELVELLKKPKSFDTYTKMGLAQQEGYLLGYAELLENEVKKLQKDSDELKRVLGVVKEFEQEYQMDVGTGYLFADNDEDEDVK